MRHTHITTQLLRILTALTLLAALQGCTTLKPKSAEPSEEMWTEQRFYQAARDAQKRKDYPNALLYLEALENRFPNHPYKELVPLETAYARYKTGKYSEALKAADQFLLENPSHGSRDYAHYIKGLIYSNQEASDEQAQIKLIRQAYSQFSQIARHYPNSKYHPEAVKRLKLIRNQLAQQELEIVKELLNKGEKTAAMKRARYLKESYPDTPAADQVFEILNLGHTTTITGSPD